MVVTQSVTKSVYSKASGLPFKNESFTINGSDGVFVFGKSVSLSMSDNGRV